jgi:lipoprotein-anchoring transpeptidase ErfK/SrfK
MNRNQYIATILLAFTALISSAEMSPREIKAEFQLMVPPQFQRALPPNLIKIEIEKIKSTPEIQLLTSPEFISVVNRHPKGQTLSIYIADAHNIELIGTSKISSGAPNRKEYFFTPVGIFENKTEYGNYRAQGTKNENGVRGLGVAGMRVYDFGWQNSHAGWGNNFPAKIRLQMHATDPDLLEQRLGTPASQGCVRVQQNVNKFIDEFGVLDKHYSKTGSWVLSKKKRNTAFEGRYMIVLDYAPVEELDK